MYCPINVGAQWRIRTTAELQELCGKKDLEAFTKKSRLKWLGHVERMEDKSVQKRMLCGRPGGRRKERRPWLRCLDEVEEDLTQIEVKRRRTKAVEGMSCRGFLRRPKSF
jgi:hypothetical protein